MIYIDSQTSPISGRREKRIDSARKVGVLHVFIGGHRRCNRIDGYYDSTVLVPNAVITCIIPSFLLLVECGKEEEPYIGKWLCS